MHMQTFEKPETGDLANYAKWFRMHGVKVNFYFTDDLLWRAQASVNGWEHTTKPYPSVVAAVTELFNFCHLVLGLWYND